MLTINEIRGLVSNLSVDEFTQQVGPFALLQKPLARSTQERAQLLAEGPTDPGRRHELHHSLRHAAKFGDGLLVATLPPLRDGDQLVVGRQPDCDLVIDDPSVSKQHALLAWDEAARRCTVRDQGSKNGVELNGLTVTNEAAPLMDADVLFFGDAQFWFVLSPTLYQMLKK
jgi:hypothetical protein